MDEKVSPVRQQAKGRRVKRKKVHADDGWTVVTHSHQQRTSQKVIDEQLRDSRVSKVVDGLTVPKLLDDFKQLQARWKDTTCAKDVTGILKESMWKIENGVCLGIGSFSLDWEHRHRSMWQLVLFMHVINLLSKDTTTFPIYAQDPVFTSLDIAFLHTLNITVVESSIENNIKSSSFLYSPFVDWALLLPMFLKDRDPELYMGNAVLDSYDVYPEIREKAKVGEECSEIGRKFLKGKRVERVPEFGLHAHALDGLVVYWKISEEERV